MKNKTKQNKKTVGSYQASCDRNINLLMEAFIMINTTSWTKHVFSFFFFFFPRRLFPFTDQIAGPKALGRKEAGCDNEPEMMQN